MTMILGPVELGVGDAVTWAKAGVTYSRERAADVARNLVKRI